jgi:glucose/arabinose dehydrogenase
MRKLPLLLLLSAIPATSQQLLSHTLTVAPGKIITLSLPAPFTIEVTATGLHRPRFFAESPDHRIFVTDMYDLSDNNRGAIYILTGWNPQTHTFSGRTAYLDHLHNPNNLAFYTDPATHQTWLYTALTDRLLRYKYAPGDNAPTSAPEVLAQFPAYGLNYKYGGWHLTRTVAFATLHGATKLFVTVGSSCNACNEKEPVRAALLSMEPDGQHQQILARGLRNAVDLEFIPALDGGALFATNMGDDQLGDKAPEDTFFELDSNSHPVGPDQNYGWPTCYFENGTAHPDPTVTHPDPLHPVFPPPPEGPPPQQIDCTRVPAAYTTFAAHSSPLGLAFFDATNSELHNSFLVALHGAGHPRIGTGYRVVRFTPVSRHPQNFILGFLIQQDGKPVVQGRPCGILQTGPDAFLLTDDHDGAIYFIHPQGQAK